MDAFTSAAELLGEMPLSAEQLAQLRAINTDHFLRLHALLRAPDGRSEERDPTGEETATLRARLVVDILEMLSPEQREALDRWGSGGPPRP